MLQFISKLLGSKSDRNIKSIQPIVEKVNAEFVKLQGISNDELRALTEGFKETIKTGLASIDDEVKALKSRIETELDMDVNEKVTLYTELDKLEKNRNKTLEVILMDILPQAFAVVKETTRRLKDNPTLEVTATEFDHTLAGKKTNVVINGEKAIHYNKWLAAGNEVTWDMVHYDVQIIGGIVLHQGKIAEMATGEGKTLVATLPAYLNALPGQGVHIVTVNDYLARRDSEWMGPLFEFHGLSVDCIDKHEPNSQERRNAYLADITFGTNNEFGFDYLRDNMTRIPEELVQRKPHYAMVDEVDSVLIDDARTPLIISGPMPRGDEHEFYELKPRIELLVNAQKNYINSILNDAKKQINDGKTDADTGGLSLLRAYRGLPKSKALIKFLSEGGNRTVLQKSENHYMQDQNKEMPKVDADLFFVIDEKNNQVELTEKGIELITTSGEDPNFFVMPDIATEIADIEKSGLSSEAKLAKKNELIRDYSIKSERIHSVNQLLKAYTLFEKDTEYILDEGKVKIVDEATGRVMDGRRYSDGLHQAIEAKENVKVEDATQTFATITLQNYFRMYHKLCGMTGTAVTEAGEFWEIYKLDVVEIPTNRPISRDDKQDLVYRTVREKYKAVADEITKLTQEGRPVLVGTTSVEISELLSRMLKLRGIKHNVLNAKMHQKEADIVAEAGKTSTVTIATNMAGRGTDIKLGPGVKEAGGLAIIGTERHESRRVDRQLRGRAGRQGDAGSSQFFVSLEDNLMRLFGSERIASLMDKMGHKEGEVLQHSMISKSIERAQKKVEENNFGTRKNLLEYDDVMNAQRNVIYKRRSHALFGDRLTIDLDDAMYEVCADIVDQFEGNRDYEAFKLQVMQHLTIEPEIDATAFSKSKTERLTDGLYQQVKDFYNYRMQTLREQMLPTLRQIRAENGDRIEDIVIPFTDGVRGLQLYTNLKDAVDQEARPIVQTLERTITLSMIDDIWKDQLRTMDDLRQSVRTASYEQKDPLLIYKFEAFNLFKQMMLVTNRNIVSFLLRAGIPMQEVPAQAQIPQQHTDMSNLRVNKAEIDAAGQDYAANENDYYTEHEEAVVKKTPVQVAPKIGRNDPCPCGSGKKYKNCHA